MKAAGCDGRTFTSVLISVLALLWGCLPTWSQTKSSAVVERSYSYPVDIVRKSLEQIGGYGGGRLPMVDGFVTALPQVERYERPYYKYRVQLTPTADQTNVVVRVEARISAWYTDGEAGQTEYRALSSNGRLEADLLDRLQAALGVMTQKEGAMVAATASSATGASSANASVSTAALKPAADVGKAPAGPANPNPQKQLDTILAQRHAVREKASALAAEIEELKTADRKLADVARLAWVKHSGVGVMSRKNYGGPVLFRAREQDEFEIVTLEAGWAEVRLSAETTGYVQADELQLPEGIEESSTLSPAPISARSTDSARTGAGDISAPRTAAGAAGPDTTPSSAEAFPAEGFSSPDLGFWASQEDVKVFSGDWVRLKGKQVLFVYAQPTGSLSLLGGENAKLAYAKQVFQSRYRVAAESNPGLAGVVVVFLGRKGGVAAATLSDIRLWVEGALPDAAFVNRCSLDPAAEFKALRMSNLNAAGAN